MSRLQAAAAALRIGGHVALEGILRPRPRNLSDVPPSIDAITCEWLTAALCEGHAGARVERFERSRGSRGTTSREALRIHYNDAGRKAHLPEYLFAKCTPGFTSRLVVGLSGALANESGFYERVCDDLDIEFPPSRYNAWNPRSCRSVFLMEDIARTRGAVFFNNEASVSRADAEGMVSLLARLHGRYWADPRLDGEFGWLRTPLEFQENTNRLIAFERRSLIGIERASHVVPAALLSRRAEIWPRVMHSLALNSETPRTYLHHDVHIGNWYRTAAGHMGLTDWQCNVKGQWASDFAYALSSALTIEHRRAWERELLAIYLDRLAESGGPRLKSDDAWLQVRQQQFHGFAFWIYTLGAGAMQPAMQPEKYSLTNIERMAQAMVDLDSLDSFTAR